MSHIDNFHQGVIREFDSAEREYKQARARVAQAATDDTTTSTALFDAALDTARAQGALAAWTWVRHTVYHAISIEAEGESIRQRVEDLILDFLITGADDTWSGRGNDHARTVFDGKRDAARDVRRLVQQHLY